MLSREHGIDKSYSPFCDVTPYLSRLTILDILCEKQCGKLREKTQGEKISCKLHRCNTRYESRGVEFV